MKSVADLGIKYTGGDFYCGHNQLTSLQGAPTSVSGGFYCSNNSLTSLEGAPAKVRGSFYCHYNQLTSLQGAPTLVGGDFVCGYNQLTSLKSIHRIIHQIDGMFICRNNPIKEGYLYVLLIKGVIHISSNFKDADKIVNKYLKDTPSGSMKAVLDVQALLEEANVRYPR